MASTEAVNVRPSGSTRDLEEAVAEAVASHRDCVRQEFARELAATFTAMRPRSVDSPGERVMDETLQMVSRTILRLAGLPEVP
ncbi:hypothetical protein AB0O28_19090 [Microbispora sp. NPDC088329]|uniref:hypothetical protein n=1 Tax=Microbispora sp. NPDC088329 TaxID=3154869 RepID=UPI00341B7EF8